MVQDVFNLQVLRPSVDFWNRELRSVCFGRASILLSPTTLSRESLFISPKMGRRSGQNPIWYIKDIKLAEKVSENGQKEKRWDFESRHKRNAGTRNIHQDKGRERKRMAEVSRQAWLAEKPRQCLSRMTLVCQNRTGCYVIVKLSAWKKMEEITHSLCLWEETVIAVDLWIKYDSTWDFFLYEEEMLQSLGAPNGCLSLWPFVLFTLTAVMLSLLLSRQVWLVMN